MEIIIFIIFIMIIVKSSNTQSQNLELILQKKNFKSIQRLRMYESNGIYLSAFANSMNYLFIKNANNAPILMMSHNELKSIQDLSRKIKYDRVVIYENLETIPIEFTKLAALYNIEIWNKKGESNFNSYRATNPNTTTSRLANTLKPENAILEHRKNGVIAQDTCHIAPSISPIEEHPSKFFKRKGPQRL